MVRARAGLIVWVVALSALTGCGGDGEPDAPAGGSGTASATPSEARVEGRAGAPGAADPNPPELGLVWLPGGALGLENVGAHPATLSRAAQLADGSEGAAERAATSLTLALGCEAPSAATPPAGSAAAASASDCFTLVPGAALELSGWPDARGECRCPPCLPASGGEVSLVVSACGGDQRLSLSAPAR